MNVSASPSPPTYRDLIRHCKSLESTEFFKGPKRYKKVDKKDICTNYLTHTGNPGIEKSKKFISLNIANIVGVKTDMVGAWLSMEGSIIKN